MSAGRSKRHGDGEVRTLPKLASQVVEAEGCEESTKLQLSERVPGVASVTQKRLE